MRVRFPSQVSRLGSAPTDVACFAPSDVAGAIETAFKVLAHHPLIAFWPKPKGRRDPGDEIKANIMFGVTSAAITAASGGSLAPVAGLIAGQVIDNGGIFVWDVLGRSEDLSKPGNLLNAQRFVQNEFGKMRADQIRKLYKDRWKADISPTILKKVCATRGVLDSSLKVHIDANPPGSDKPAPPPAKRGSDELVLEITDPAPKKDLTKKPPPSLVLVDDKFAEPKDLKKPGFPWWLALIAIPFL